MSIASVSEPGPVPRSGGGQRGAFQFIAVDCDEERPRHGSFRT
jgi:hypothetical protein